MGAVDPARIDWLSIECARRGITLIYFDVQGDAASVYRRSVNRETIEIPRFEDVADGSNRTRELACSEVFWKEVPAVPAGLHEQNFVASAYGALLDAGVSVRSVSLETFFQFAKGRSKEGNDRPDLTLFDPKVRGAFNLYQKGKTAQSLDAFKLMHLCAMVEFKVNPSAVQALADIRKLDAWREKVAVSCAKNGIAVQSNARYIFVAHDAREEVLQPCEDLGRNLGIDVFVG